MTRNIKERTKMVKAMEFIVRNINDEEILDPWLSCGVPDGDIEYGDLGDDVSGTDYFTEDDNNFAELMGLFMRCMSKAYASGGLYCGGVVSKIRHETEVDQD